MAKKKQTLAELVLELDDGLEPVDDASAVEVAVEDWERLVAEARELEREARELERARKSLRGQ